MEAASPLWGLIAALAVVVGGSVFAVLVFFRERWELGLVLGALLAGVVLLEGAFRLDESARANRDEASASIGELEEQLASKARADDFRNRLAEFLHGGNELRIALEAAVASGITFNQTFVFQQMEEWGQRVEQYLSEQSPHLVPLWRKEPNEGLPERLPELAYFRAWIVTRTGHLETFLREVSR